MKPLFVIKTLLYIVFTCIFVFITKDALAATYYVSTSGNNNSSGSSSAPWQTISKAASTMVAGDTVIVAAGTYNERVSVSRSGAAGNLITYRTNGTVITHGFTIKANYVEVNGFEITNTPDNYESGAGIFLQGNHCNIISNYIHDVTRIGIFLYSSDTTPNDPLVSYNLVKNNRIVRAGVSAGISIQGQNNTIEGNDISHTIQYPPAHTAIAGWEDADGIRFFGSNHSIRKNYIHDILLTDTGNTDPHIDCFQTYGPASNITFEQNYCVNKTNGMQGFMLASQNGAVNGLYIKNNIIETFACVNARPDYPSTNVRFYNNLCIGSLSYTDPSFIGVQIKNNNNNWMVENNIFYNIRDDDWPNVSLIGSVQGLQIGHNLVYTSDSIAPRTASYFPTATDLWMRDPKIANLYSANPNVQAGSPLVDAGYAVSGLTNDYYGNSRPQGKGYDIGPFEFAYIGSPQGPTVR